MAAPKLTPTKTTWVAKDPDGQMVAVKVTDMSDDHLWRWIRFFRRKWRDERGYKGSNMALDVAIMESIITAPAIYAEASKRGVMPDFPTPEDTNAALDKIFGGTPAPTKTFPTINADALAKVLMAKVDAPSMKSKLSAAAIEKLLSEWPKVPPKNVLVSTKAKRGKAATTPPAKPVALEPGPPGVRRINLAEDE